jgi:5-deoxy-glucuronate isomerase
MKKDERANSQLHLPSGSSADERDLVVITPESARWSYAGLRVFALAAGEQRAVDTGLDEALVLPLAGACTVKVGNESFLLEGRASVFDRITDFVYVPMRSSVQIASASGGTFALPTARASRRGIATYVAADQVAVEVRGAGSATRQLNNFFSPSVGDADRLVAVEVLTPGGNISSYPPHKHDRASDAEAQLEEIYYFRFDKAGAFGMHRTYAADGGFDVTVTVRDGDVFLVPSGYHGPCAAMPGYDMYYLNVLAGSGASRSLAFTDDPAHAWIRQSWSGEARDARVPMTSAYGRLR